MGSSLDTQELVDQARQGDVYAYQELIRRYQHLGFRVALLVTGSVAHAEDALQNAIIRAYSGLSQIRSNNSFRSWLLAIVANEARNLAKSEQRHAHLDLELVPERPEGEPTPENVILEREDQRHVLVALKNLPEPARTILICRYVLDLSEAETAAMLGCSRGTVKSRTWRALRQLRRVLKTSGEEAVHEPGGGLA